MKIFLTLILSTFLSISHSKATTNGIIVAGKIKSFDLRSVTIEDQYLRFQLPRSLVPISELKANQDIKIRISEADSHFVLETPLRRPKK